MSKLLVKIGNEARSNSIIVLLVWLAWCALVAVALRLVVEDYTTSLLGYQAIPTRKTDASLAYFVAALPTLLQVAFGWLAIERRQPLPTMIAVAALVVDISTDLAYKIVDWTPVSVAWGVGETLLLFTLGSEFLLMTAGTNAVEYLPDAIAAAVIVLARIGDAFGHVTDWLTGASRQYAQDSQANGQQHNGGQRHDTLRG